MRGCDAVRTILLVLGALTLLVGGAIFYLVGGRALVRSHKQALQRATRDGLTDLPNHRAFQDEFPQAVATAQRHQDSLALAVLDIDDFKFTNDRHGHPHGDALLRRLTEVLREGRTGDRVYRVGGDEFIAVLPHTDAEGVRVFARRLHRRAAEAKVRISIGVSSLRPGQPAADLRIEADAALYEAKRQGGDGVAHFDDIRHRIVVTTADKRAALRALLDEPRLGTHFQSIWDLDSGTLLGVEALSRPDPIYGFSGPAEAFDVAEQTGHVHELDALCVEQALKVAPRLPSTARCSSSTSARRRSTSTPRATTGCSTPSRASGLAPQRVVIEVTERFGGRTSSVVKCLERLRDQGFKIALDDVGTGNSGLEILSKVNAEFVKIDASIVAAAVTEPGARAVLMAMATFARQTDAFVIAEGIEDQDTLDFLRRIDDGELQPGRIFQGGQGFGLGTPAASLTSLPALPLRRTRRAA